MAQSEESGEFIKGLASLVVLGFVGYLAWPVVWPLIQQRIGTPTATAPTLRAAAVEPSAGPAKAAIPAPQAEIDYIGAITAARPAYAGAGNELRQSSVEHNMEDAMRAAVKGARAEGWIGMIDSMGTNGDGDAWIVVTVADGMTVHTTNNSLSDTFTHTLIKHGSPLYERIADLKKGDTVQFSAQLLKLTDLTERGKVEEPEMEARFSAIEPVH